MEIDSFLNSLYKNPKKVFLIDASGALISLFSFWCIVYPLENYFTISSSVLLLLSVIAFTLFLYSFSCYMWIKQNWKPYLKTIIILNSLYILFSIGLIFYHFKKGSLFGIAYFILEIVVILAVLFVEIKVYKKI